MKTALNKSSYKNFLSNKVGQDNINNAFMKQLERMKTWKEVKWLNKLKNSYKIVLKGIILKKTLIYYKNTPKLIKKMKLNQLY